MARLTFYGGVEEIGGNKVLLEEGDLKLFFDFGTPYGKRGDFFEEYLTPRPGAGLLDLLEMDLLPPLKGIYREDLAQHISWEHFQAHHPHYREAEVQGVLLSHAHLDHSGYISFLRRETPIYTSPMTAFISKAIQDTGKSDLERELCFLSPREKKEGYLATAGKSYLPRPFVLSEPFPLEEEARAFWGRSPAKSKGLKTTIPTTLNTSAPVRFFPVDHSVFGAGAFAVETWGVGAGGEGGVFALGAADGGVGAVAGEDEGVVGEGIEAAGDGGDTLLEVGGGLGAAGAAGEEDVAGEKDAADPSTRLRTGEVARAARGVAGRVEGPDRASADGDLVAIGKRAVDLRRGHDDFGGMAEDGGAGGVLHEVVVGPVVRVRVGEDERGHLQVAERVEDRAATGGHVYDERLAGVMVGDEVGVVAVGA